MVQAPDRCQFHARVDSSVHFITKVLPPLNIDADHQSHQQAALILVGSRHAAGWFNGETSDMKRSRP